jgi:hypothetical protein
MNDANIRSMIADFVIRHRQSGVCLSYDEYKIIDEWIALAGEDTDRLILVLGEEIPKLYHSETEKKKFPPQLKTIRRRVTKRLPVRI